MAAKSEPNEVKKEEEQDEQGTVDEKREEEEEEAKPTEPELPPEVDAFFKGKNKYKHPYGPWKPVVKAEPLKRKTFGDQLDLPADNWHLPQNQPVPVIPETKDESEVKLIFKEKEAPSLSASSSSTDKKGAPVTFKKRKTVPNRQLRGADDKDS